MSISNSSAPASSYPGYQDLQQQGDFSTTDQSINLGGLGDIFKRVLGLDLKSPGPVESHNIKTLESMGWTKGTDGIYRQQSSVSPLTKLVQPKTVMPNNSQTTNQNPAQQGVGNPPTPTPTLHPTLMGLIQKYFPKDQWDNAAKVVQGESGGNTQAIGDNYPINGEIRPSYGAFQIRTFPGRPDPQQLLNPETNVKYAADLYNRQGWSPWSAAKRLGIVK